ncbi:hypothetical protein B0H34DRAFT_728647, partial [Crassisporium funariophilum]
FTFPCPFQFSFLTSVIGGTGAKGAVSFYYCSAVKCVSNRNEHAFLLIARGSWTCLLARIRADESTAVLGCLNVAERPRCRKQMVSSRSRFRPYETKGC